MPRTRALTCSTLLAIGALAGCANPAHLAGAARVSEQPDPIVAGPDSNICSSVHVDDGVWGQRFDPETARNVSGVLSGELQLIHQARGGSYFLPGTSAQRFIVNTGGTATYCRQDADVFVELHYRPRTDGRPFIVDYRIRRGTMHRSGTVDIDVAEEMRRGRIRGYTERRTNSIVVVEDIRERAQQLMDALYFN